MPDNERQAWTTFYNGRKERWASFAPTSKAADSEAKLRQFIKETPIPVLTDMVVPAPAVEPARSGGRTKYRNVKTGGYASKKEAKRAAELKLREAAGEIRNLEEQVSYLIVPKQNGERAAKYVADFRYEERFGDDWVLCVEDCKGMRTPLYVLKRKLMGMVHGIKLKET